MNVKNRACIRRLSFRTLYAARRRNLIAIAAIALTSLLFTSLFTIAMSMNSSSQEYTFRQMGGYCHGTFKDVNEEQIAAISAHKKVKETGVRKMIGTISDGVFGKKAAEVSFMDENCAKWSYIELTEGHLPKSGREIIMDTEALRLLGAEPVLGAEITLTFTVGDKNQIAFDKTDTFTLAGWWEEDDICPVHYLNVSEEYAAEIEAEGIAAGMDPFRYDLNVMMASSLDIRGQMEAVDTDLGYTWDDRGKENNVRIGVNWGYTSSQVGERMDLTTLVGAAAFLILVIFTGYLIIYNVFQISVAGDIRFYGLLKTIGVTPRQLRRMIRQQALLLCAAGIPVGLILGYVLGSVLTPVVMAESYYGASRTVISTSPLIFVFSALFALGTVLLSCARPGRMAGRVSPVEASKYTETLKTKKKNRSTRGAKVHQMAFANLGRNKSKTVLVVVSLSLSVVLLNTLVVFVSGFDTEKYLESKSCADFIVSSTDYFRFRPSEAYLPEGMTSAIEAGTEQSLSGCGYTIPEEPVTWVDAQAWKQDNGTLFSEEALELQMSVARDGQMQTDCQIEGLDEALFEKLTVLEGDLSPLFEENSHAIALCAGTDDYGNPSVPESFPAIGEKLEVSYVTDGWYIDSRTGEKCDESTPEEYLEYYIADSRDISYTVCAYVTVPYSMSYRYSKLGLEAVLPAGKLDADSGSSLIPMFYLFDTPDEETEKEAESFLSRLTAGDTSTLMYESKASIREEFESFRDMFALLGGVLCAVIGVVGILNFFNSVMTGILSRRREFAVLQSVGMTNRQLKSMLVYEGLFYAFGAAGTALLLSLVISPLSAELFSKMFAWFSKDSLTFLPVLFMVPVFAFSGWLIPSLMYGQTAKQSIVERLRETE